MIPTVPAGFRWVEGAAGRVWVLRNSAPLGPGTAAWDEWLAGSGGGEPLRGGGRMPPRVVELPGAGEVVVRRYLRGGLLARLDRDLHGSERRPLQELEVSEALRGKGIRTPEILALHWRRGALGLVRACLVTRRIPEGRNLRQWIREEGRDRRRWGEVLAPAANAVAALHAAGCVHRDLNLSNLLWTGSALHILDLDGGRLVRRITVGERGRNLLRLYRSLAKEAGEVEPLGLRDRLRFLGRYAAGNPPLRRKIRGWLAWRWGPARLRRIIRHRLRRS